MDSAIVTVGDRFQVGQIPVSFTNFSLGKIFPGLATINGPLCVGASSGDVPIANAIFGPGFFPISSPGTTVSLASVGVTNIFGKFNVLALSDVVGITNKWGATLRYALSLNNGVDIANTLKLGNGPVVINGPLTLNGLFTATEASCVISYANIATIFSEFIFSQTGQFGSLIAPSKNFVIPHPSKPGYKLVHACLEGPENGVYYRGHLTNDNKITLPDYWDNLIDTSTITVHLTPHKFHQELYVKSIEWGKVIHIVNNNGGPIDCDYVVYAERKDVEKLKIEIKDEK